NTVLDAAKTCGEALWQLPMFAEYGEMIKSDVADIKNIGDGRSAGAITAAKFLEEFVGQTPWTHMDIAGPAFSDKSQTWIDGGATGAFVRTLVEVARGWCERRGRLLFIQPLLLPLLFFFLLALFVFGQHAFGVAVEEITTAGATDVVR